MTFDVVRCGKYYDFNSHAHVERDLLWGVYPPHTLHFNSHAHVERDGTCRYFVELFGISTHTLTWSVTVVSVSIVSLYIISTHTLTWSVTLDVVYIWCLLNVMRTYFFI